MDTPNLPPKAPVAPTPVVVHDPIDVEKNKDLAAFSYTWVMSVFMLLFKHHSPFVHFHARQASLLFVLSVIFWFVPVVGRFLEIFVFIGFAWGFITAAQGKWEDVPFVGPLARGKISVRESWKRMVAGILHAFHEAKGLWHKHDHSHTEPVVPTAHTPPPPAPQTPDETPPSAWHPEQ